MYELLPKETKKRISSPRKNTGYPKVSNARAFNTIDKRTDYKLDLSFGYARDYYHTPKPTQLKSTYLLRDKLSDIETGRNAYGLLPRNNTVQLCPDNETGVKTVIDNPIIGRIRALLNLLDGPTTNTDRNDTLYNTMKLVLKQVSTPSSTSKKKGGSDPFQQLKKRLKNTDSNMLEILNEFPEHLLPEVEKTLSENENIRNRRNIFAVYGNFSIIDSSSHFTDDFIKHHFAPNFDEAFVISKDRFDKGETSSNTVLLKYQINDFYAKEKNTIKAAHTNTFTTEGSYYYWKFLKDKMVNCAKPEELTEPNNKELRKIYQSKINLNANEGRKIYHLDGTESATPISSLSGTEIRHTVQPLTEMSNKMDELANLADSDILREIAKYTLEIITSMLINSDFSEPSMLYGIGTSVINFLRALDFYNTDDLFRRGITLERLSETFANLQDDIVKAAFNIRGQNNILESATTQYNAIFDEYLIFSLHNGEETPSEIT